MSFLYDILTINKMINWQSVIFNSLWILGLAVLLAALSYHYWVASVNKRPLREQFSQPDFLRLLWVALLLVCLGLAGTSQQNWEMIVWGVLALFALVNIAGLSRKPAQQ